MIKEMAFWNKNKSSSENILSGKELRDLIQKRKQERGHSLDKKDYYWIGFWINAIITFIGCWIYAIAHYGFFLGVGLGWIPSLFIAALAGLLWPLIDLALLIIMVTVVIVLIVGIVK